MKADLTPAFLAAVARQLSFEQMPVAPEVIQQALAAACAEVMGEKGGSVWVRYEAGECRVKVWKWEVR